jgi:WD40 repeat protein
LKAMSLKPVDRYPSVKGMADDVEHWLADEPTTASVDTWSDHLARFSRRHRSWAFAGTASLFVIAIVAVLAGLVVDGKRREARQSAVNEGIAKDNAIKAAESERLASRMAQEARAAAKSQADDYRHRLSQHYVKNGEQAIEAQDLSLALLWFVKALQVDIGDSLREPQHRIRIAMTRRQMPRLIKLLEHQAPISNLELSHSGKLLVTASYDGTSRIWDLATGKPVGQPLRHGGHVYQARFSPDDSYIATGSGNGSVCLWNAATGNQVGEPLAHSGPVGHLAFSPDGRRLATSCGRPADYLVPPLGVDTSLDAKPNWDLLSGAVWEIPSLKLVTSIPTSPQSTPGPIAWSPNGDIIVSSRHGIQFFHANTGEVARRTIETTKSTLAVTFVDERHVVAKNHDGKYSLWDLKNDQHLLTEVTLDGAINLGHLQPLRIFNGFLIAGREKWELKTGKLADVRGDKSTIGEVTISDRKYLLQRRSPNSFHVYSPNTGALVSPALWHELALLPVQVSRDRRYFAFVGGKEQNVLEIWDLAGQGSETVAPEFQSLVSKSRRFYHYERGQVTGCGAVTLMTNQSGRTVATQLIHGHPDDRVSVMGGILTPDEKLAVTAGTDLRIRFWDGETGKPSLPSINVEGFPEDLTISPDGQLIVGIIRQHSSEAAIIKGWRVADRQAAWADIRAGYRANMLQFSASGRLFSWRNGEGSVEVRETNSGRCVVGPLMHSYWVGLPQFNPKEDLLAVPCGDGLITIWTIPGGEKKHVLRQSPKSLHAEFSHDGNLLATSDFNCVSIWNVSTGKLSSPILRVNGQTNSLRFSSDDRTLLVAMIGIANAASIWDVATGERLSPPFYEPGNLLATFSPEGKTFETHGESTQLWKLEPDDSSVPELLAFAIAAAGRDLDSTGQISSVSSAERIKAWKTHPANTHQDYCCSSSQVLSWRLRQLNELLNASWDKDPPLETTAILDQLLAENPERMDLLGLASVYQKTGFPRRAIECSVKRILAFQGLPQDWRLLDSNLVRSEDKSFALQASEAALLANPEHHAAWTLKALTLMYQRDFDASIKALTKAIELGASGQAFSIRGSAHAQAEHWADAESDFQSLLNEEPNDFLALRGLLAVRLATGNLNGWNQTASELNHRLGEVHYGGPSIDNETAIALLARPFEPESVLKKVAAALAKSPSNNGLQMTHAAYRYRADNFQHSIDELSKQMPTALGARELLFFAMAKQKIKSSEEAKSLFSEATRKITKAEQNNDWRDWRERLEIMQLKKEAADLIGTPLKTSNLP